MAVTVRFDAEMGDYVSGVDEAITAIRGWESQTGVSALNVTEKFEDAIRGVLTLGTATGKTRDEMKRALEGMGLDAEAAEDAIKAVERETAELGRKAPADVGKAEDAVKDLGAAADTADAKTAKISDTASKVGDGVRSLGDIARDVLAGDFGSATESALDSLVALGAGIGLGGAAGTAVLGALGGLVTAMLEEMDVWGQKSAAIRDQVASDLVAVGGAFTEADLQSRYRDVVNDTEKWAAANTIAAQTGGDISQIVRALAGDTDALTAVTGEYDTAMRNAFDDNMITQAMRDASTELEGVSSGLDLGASKADIVAQAMKNAAGEASAANSKYDAFRENLLSPIPNPPPVKLTLDDSAIRNYKPPTIHIPGRVVAKGTVEWQ